MPDKQLPYLFNQYINGQCSATEREEFFRLLQREDNRTIMEELINTAEEGSEIDVSAKKADEIYKKIRFVIEHQPARRIQLLNWRRIAVAASILLVVGISSYFLFFDKPANQNEIVQTVPQATDVKAPEINRAMITLADGKTIYLDSAMNGQLATQGSVKLVKLANGQIAYETANGKFVNEIQYNTLHNPRGSKVIDMTLTDGSRVWLNAGSSVTYPVVFIGNERMVSIEGEAYFEVTHDASRQFKVTKGSVEIAVLGTHFNVNAYNDEDQIKVTLLEGSVKISTTKILNNSTILSPGQQARITEDNQLKKLNEVDTDQVMAWKNGLFSFKGTDINEIMKQVARWYDVEIYFQEPIDERFYGDISRSTNASNLFKMLESTGSISFIIEGKKVIVRKGKK